MSEGLPNRAEGNVAPPASLGLQSRVRRLLWGIIWFCLASWSQPFHGWRRSLLRAFGAKVGKGVYIAPSARIWDPKNLVLDDFAAVADGADLYTMAAIHIGTYAVVSKRAHLCAGTHDIASPSFTLMAAPINIEPYAWVAAEAFVGPNVTIQEGAVLGARGVTVKDLNAWTVYAGNPVCEIRKRPPFTRSDEPKRGWQEAFMKD